MKTNHGLSQLHFHGMEFAIDPKLFPADIAHYASGYVAVTNDELWNTIIDLHFSRAVFTAQIEAVSGTTSSFENCHVSSFDRLFKRFQLATNPVV